MRFLLRIRRPALLRPAAPPRAALLPAAAHPASRTRILVDKLLCNLSTQRISPGFAEAGRHGEFGINMPNVVEVSLKGLCQDLRHKFRMIQAGLPFGSPAFLFSHGMANFYGMKMITKW